MSYLHFTNIIWILNTESNFNFQVIREFGNLSGMMIYVKQNVYITNITYKLLKTVKNPSIALHIIKIGIFRR